MKKKILLVATIFSIVLITTSSMYDIQDTCDSPVVGGHTGAPGSEDCTYCHGGTPNTGPGSVTFDLGAGITQYVVGQTYDCTVTVAQDSLTKYGFCVTARKSNNASSGDFVLLDSIYTRKFTESGKKYFSHTPCGADAIVPGIRTWGFKWTAPMVNDGAITFYLSSLASNHDENTTGDYTYTLTKVLDAATGVSPENTAEEVDVFPIPAVNEISVLLNIKEAAVITLVDGTGKEIGKIKNENASEKISIRKNDWNLHSGVYLLKIQTNDQIITKKILFL